MKNTARLAGLLYLIFIFCGFFYLRYVPTHLVVHDDAATTFGNITAHQTLFRLGILIEIFADLLFLFLVLVFYRLLNKVNNTHAVVMVLLVAFSIVTSFIGLQHKLAVLSLINNASYLHAFAPDNLKAQVMLQLNLYNNGNLTGQVFWGLWLFPLGYLTYQSGFLPKIIGVMLMVGCFGYLANFTATLLYANYSDTLLPNYVTLPASLGELSICLWLLIMGVKAKKPV